MNIRKIRRRWRKKGSRR